MSATIPPRTEPTDRDGLERDFRMAITRRVGASSGLQRSRRLQELLLYISEHALRDPDAPIREQDIGVAVFGRQDDYNTSEDTIVRVHIFQLRKRLKEYFDQEGVNEPVIIELPKGSYKPAFVTRPQSREPVATSAANPRRGIPAAVWVAAALLAGVAAGWQLRTVKDLMAVGVADRFWTQMFANGKPIDLVVGDASASFFQGIAARDVSLREYQLRDWDNLSGQVPDPARRELAKTLLNYFFVPFSDTVAARILGVASARSGLPLDIVFARDFSADHMETRNAILEGNRRSNPWMEFFEPRLNFRYGFDITNNYGYFRNVKPIPGELEIYRVQWNTHGFARVAYLPDLAHSGTVLILSGTDVQSADAGARFVTSNEWIDKLRERFGLGRSEPIPYFEALLQTDLLMASAPEFNLVAVRRLNP
jgi:hypothetical protein